MKLDGMRASARADDCRSERSGTDYCRVDQREPEGMEQLPVLVQQQLRIQELEAALKVSQPHPRLTDTDALIYYSFNKMDCSLVLAIHLRTHTCSL